MKEPETRLSLSRSEINMAALMPNMLPLLMPRIVPAMLACLKEGDAVGVPDGKAA